MRRKKTIGLTGKQLRSLWKAQIKQAMASWKSVPFWNRQWEPTIALMRKERMEALRVLRNWMIGLAKMIKPDRRTLADILLLYNFEEQKLPSSNDFKRRFVSLCSPIEGVVLVKRNNRIGFGYPINPISKVSDMMSPFEWVAGRSAPLPPIKVNEGEK